ncbi:MAG TPA: amidohydrolase family protein [Chitinophagaceae bacterium]|nr:amidohydrolase family protein [Chitinophagaceae bacterium]
MVLRDVHILNNGVADIVTTGSEITGIVEGGGYAPGNNDIVIQTGNSLAFPGIINSHDHLEFNLFPQLRSEIYKSYMYWGEDIHSKNKEVIQAVLKVPVSLRAQWGMYKNLLCGITSVVQHGEKQVIENSPVTIFNQCHSLHSVRLEKNWKLKLNHPFASPHPFVIHTGEGTDRQSFEEINELIRWNLLGRQFVGVHGVAMSVQQAAAFKALVWCPESNFFLLGATAEINKLKASTKILFGTDSTLSAGWNIWQHLRNARKTTMLTDEEILAAVFYTAATMWGLNNTGAIKQGYYADIVVAEKKGEDGYYAFFGCNPENILLVLAKGKIVLFDALLQPQLNSIDIENYSRVFIHGRCKYVAGNLPALIREIKKYSPGIDFPVDIE